MAAARLLSNVIGALREEDYSFRARNAVAEDALGELSLEVNALADMLSDEKIRILKRPLCCSAWLTRSTRRFLLSIPLPCCAW